MLRSVSDDRDAETAIAGVDVHAAYQTKPNGFMPMPSKSSAPSAPARVARGVAAVI